MRVIQPQRTASLVALIVLLLTSSARASEADVARTTCETAIDAEQAGGRPGSSRLPCRNAYIQGNTPRDMRNEVTSMLSTRGKPSLDDLSVATLIADAAVRAAPGEAWGYLARCEVARRLGSADVLETCLRDLRRVAPDAPATKAALALAPEPTSWELWLARFALVAGLLGTLAHALVRRRTTRRSSTPLKVAAGIALAFALALVGPAAARADEPAEPDEGMSAPADPLAMPDPRKDLSHFKIDDANPEASVPTLEQRNKGPLQFGYFIQDLVTRGERSAKQGDHAAAARYYRALSAASADTAVGPRRLCEELEAAHDLPGAVIACRTTLTRGGVTAGDYTRFVHVALAKPGPLLPLEEKELAAVIDHVSAEAQLGALVPVLRCEVALRAHDMPALESCTRQLATAAPNDPKTVSFQWAVALDRQDRAAAEHLVERAREVGVAPEGIARMEAATNAMSRQRTGRLMLVVLAVVVAGVILALGARRLRGATVSA
jgi:hypothetical protein